MAYDEMLADRIRDVLAERTGFSERKMFGGIAFMLGGHMCCGIVGDDLMLRVGPERYAQSLARPHVSEMDFTGRPLKGMIYVKAPGFRTQRSLRSWVELAAAFVLTLPPKPRARAARSRRRK